MFLSNYHTSNLHRRPQKYFTFIAGYISVMLALGFHHIRVHAPGATEAATVRNDFICMICSSPLKEDVKFRVLGGENEAF